MKPHPIRIHTPFTTPARHDSKSSTMHSQTPHKILTLHQHNSHNRFTRPACHEGAHPSASEVGETGTDPRPAKHSQHPHERLRCEQLPDTG